ncbi:MAG: glycosyltransferase [Acidimicrobiia bacterium]|nr:glycosyltransferase [Acidimicrobiia bacterium]
MPTLDRRAFVPLAIELFLRQDYPNKELHILDDGTDPVGDLVPDDPAIRYERIPNRMALGDKRNLACELSEGTLIAHWDDDDWYASDRLWTQVAALEESQADINGLSSLLFYDPVAGQAWRYQYPTRQRRPWVAGSSLLYRRSFWAEHPFESVGTGEDTRFVWQSRSDMVSSIGDERLMVAMIHRRNTARKNTRGSRWSRVPVAEVESILGEDCDVIGNLSAEPLTAPRMRRESPGTTGIQQSTFSERGQTAAAQRTFEAFEGPLVSCIMPTHNRRTFVPFAIEYFLRQDYPRRELIVVDDGTDSVADLIPDDPSIRYVRLERPTSLGAKRNRACELAEGEVIVHWDDDDWSAPWRLSYQVSELLRTQSDVSGLRRVTFYDIAAQAAWEYTYPPSRAKPWVSGGTLCYTKSLWERNAFPQLSQGESTAFLWQTRNKKVHSLTNSSFYVAMIHDANSGRKNTAGSRWRRTNVSSVQALIGGDLDRYAGAGDTQPVRREELNRRPVRRPRSRSTPRTPRIDFLAEASHYVDHLVPIWDALDEPNRGRFMVPARVVPHARRRGLSPVVETHAPSGGPIAVAGYGDLMRVGGRPVVYVEHGAGQTYGNGHPAYSDGPGRDKVRLFISPSRTVAEQSLRTHPGAVAVAVGCPKLDRWLGGEPKARSNPPVVAISFHWECRFAPEARGAYEHYRSALPDLAGAFTVLGHGHPNLIRQIAPHYSQLGIEVVYDFEEVLERADVYVVDNSSTLFEFGATGRPVVVLNAPWYRRTVDHGLRFWDYADVGIQVDDPASLVSAVHDALLDPPAVARRRREVVDSVYESLDGSASVRAAAAIRSLLADR